MRVKVAVLCAVLCASCAPRELGVSANPQLASKSSEPEEWTANMSFLKSVASGGQYEQHQLGEAVYFFERITGEPCGLDQTALGLILDYRVLSRAISGWEKWYRTRGSGMKWDSEAQTFVDDNEPRHP